MSGQSEWLSVLHVIHYRLWGRSLAVLGGGPAGMSVSLPLKESLVCFSKVTAGVTQRERQAGMAGAHRKLVINGENIFEA